ncbi:hypothetical protein ABR738_36380 [Streptomyces sp. Edi4]
MITIEAGSVADLMEADLMEADLMVNARNPCTSHPQAKYLSRK